MNAWHAWLLTPLADGTTHVLTEETQTGWRARLGKLLTPQKMSRMHQAWLEGLRHEAMAAVPKGRREAAA